MREGPVKKTAKLVRKESSTKAPSSHGFFDAVARVIEEARRHVARTVDVTMCVTFYEIGRRIVEQEQKGSARAEYGREMLAKLAGFLAERFGKGFSETNLRNARKFYLTYASAIQQTPSAELGKGQSVPDLFRLGWSHYQVLMRIKDEKARRFYEIEAINQQWSVTQLQRQYNSSLYERLALSRNKDGVMRLASEGQVVEKPQDVLKNPLVLEFLGMEEKAAYSESDLENAVIGKLQHFLLEMGKGFLFEARQKRFTFDEEHFFVDLVFYNRLLRCYVLIDLKTQKLKHQDIGQMQMYVNYFDRCVKRSGENPTVGILLCKEKNDSIVQMTLPENANIYASEYSLYLPDKILLQSKLAEWAAEFEETRKTVVRK
jgi:predicted nuclease of restriction endonuclease-like (RecB) superfamily